MKNIKLWNFVLCTPVCFLMHLLSGESVAAGPQGDTPSVAVETGETELDLAQAKLRFKKGRGYFNFEKAELVDVVKQVSKLTLSNFIVPEKLKSQKMTIICEQPVTTQQAFRAFLSALEVSGLTLVESGEFYKIIKRSDGVKKSIPTFFSEQEMPAHDGLITAVVELQHIEVSWVEKLVRSLIAKEASLHTLPPSLLILSDSAANVGRVRQLLRRIDVKGTRDQIHVVEIHHASAESIAKRLQQLFVTKGKRAQRQRPLLTSENNAPGSEPGHQQVQVRLILSDDRTNRLIVVCDQRSFGNVMELVEMLDVAVDEKASHVYFYPLNNGVAQETAKTLNDLIKGNQRKKGKTDGPAPSSDLFEGQVKITADKASNGLVVVATPKDYAQLLSIIDYLDAQRSQVFVEAVILEISLRSKFEVGLNAFHGMTVDVPGQGETLGLMANPGAHSMFKDIVKSQAQQQFQESSGGQQNPTPAMSPTGLAAMLGFLAFQGPPIPGSDKVVKGGLPSFGAVLHALQGEGDVDVLSTPHILTLDNERAEIMVGEVVPFASALASGATSLNPTIGVERRDVAIKLAVTPRVSDDGRIRLEIEQEVSDLGEAIPVGEHMQHKTTKRSTKTTVVVKDQQTIVLGGLISNKQRQTDNQIPLLGDIPVVGWLFKSRLEESDKKNLLLILTPYIIDSEEDFRHIYKRKLAERAEFIERFYGTEDPFRTPLEFRTKVGPFASLHRHIVLEMQKKENGGPGVHKDIIIQAPGAAENGAKVVPLPDP